MFLRIVILLPAVFLLAPLAISADTLIVNSLTNQTNRYCAGLLKLALEHSGTQYKFEYLDHQTGTQTREIEYVSGGKLSVMWTGTSTELEGLLRPIRVPLFKGLLGHRLLIIREGDQPRFDGIKSLDDLKNFTLGQGEGWADTEILKANKLNLVTAPKYHSLFFMLDGGRFDAFPRGVLEVWREVEKERQVNGNQLRVEANLMLVYQMPMYFFVSRENEKLAKDIEKGLLAILENGKFDEHFFNDPMVKGALENGNLKNRRTFHLTNPTLPPNTPLDNKLMWH